MAIQIRRGSNAEWESNNSNIVVGEPAVATDSKRAFIGTASGAYMELANLEAIAPAYDPGNSYMVGDYTSYQGKLYVCTVPTSGAWNASCWQVTSIGQALAENAYSNYETYTMSGDIVSFPNGAGGIPVKDLKADVVAVQNLNGYDHPWVGGAGKNKFKASISTQTVSDVVFTVNSDGTIKASGTATADVYLTIGSYTFSAVSYSLSGCPSGGGNSTFGLYASFAGGDNKMDHGSGVVFTATATTANLRIFVRNGVHIDDTFKPMLAESSSVEAYEPYSNICPISGWDEVNVNVMGKNLLNSALCANRTSNGITTTHNADGSITFSGTASATNRWWSASDNMNVFFKAGTYTLSSSLSMQLYFHNSGYKSGTFTLTADDTIDNIRFVVTNGTTYNTTVKPQLELGSTATAYEPYNGQTYTTDLDDTRYGGTLDVTSGVLTLTYGYVDLGTLTWVSETSAVTGMFRTEGNNMPSVPLLGGNLICSQYKGVNKTGYAQLLNGEIAVTNIQSGSFLRIVDVSKTSMTASQFKTAMSGVQLAYQLYSTQTVQLTPQQVRTVLGQNNIWADSGSVEVTYRISNVQ